MVKVRYLYKLRPGAVAQEHLREEHSRCRWVWNECVHQFRSRQKPTAAKLDKKLTEARANLPWLREGSSVVQQQVIREYATALNASFSVKGRGRPSPKTRKKHPYVSLNYTVRGFSIDKDKRLRLAGGITVPVVWSRELPSTPTSVRVYEDAAGWWWASFVVDVPEPDPLPPTGRAIGIDWGVKTSATTTDPEFDLEYSGIVKRHAKGLTKYQRRMSLHHTSGAKEQSTQYKKAKKRVAREYRTARWQRQEHSRQWASKVVTSHDQLAVEDFKPKFLAKTTMAKKAADAALGAMCRELKYQASKAGRTMVMVPPAYTTMTCSSCGVRAKHRLPLKQRTFHCWSCGFEDDRDRNAARVILYQAGFNLAPDDGVIPATASVVQVS